MTRIALNIAALLFSVSLAGCAAVRPVADQAANVVDAACELGLVRSPAVRAAAEERMVAPEWLSTALCALPAAYQAWQDAQKQRAADPGAAAVLAAERQGL
jgi:hypothetical protein